MSERAIEIVGVTRRFGAKVAVDGVSLSVNQGEVYGLIGPNGAGKTTTFSMLCGYLRPTGGTLRVHGGGPLRGRRPQGEDWRAAPGRDAARRAGRWGHCSRTGRGFSGLATPEQEARTSLERVGLMEAWGVETHALSHGMAKRAALAQALMGKPPLVLLDEPTAGLDPRIADQVRQVIRELKEQHTTVVVSSHNLQELEQLCDAAAILDRGKLAQAGTMAELTGQGAEFRVQVARGTVLLPELQALPGVISARMEGETLLHVRFDGQAHPPEEVISRVVGHLLQTGVLILGVSRGRRLEERVLQLT